MVNAAFGSRRKASTGFTSSLACNAFFVQRSFRRRRFSPSVSRRARHSSKNCSARISLSRLHLRGGQTDTSLFERRDIFPTFVNPASLPKCRQSAAPVSHRIVLRAPARQPFRLPWAALLGASSRLEIAGGRLDHQGWMKPALLHRRHPHWLYIVDQSQMMFTVRTDVYVAPAPVFML
jgi:hypothetical protein